MCLGGREGFGSPQSLQDLPYPSHFSPSLSSLLRIALEWVARLKIQIIAPGCCQAPDDKRARRAPDLGAVASARTVTIGVHHHVDNLMTPPAHACNLRRPGRQRHPQHPPGGRHSRS